MKIASWFLLAGVILGCTQPDTLTEVQETEVEYTRLTPTAFRQRIAEAPIAYLPLGTLEWHGEHLPLGSDGMQAFSFMKDLAREAGGIVLPMLYLGPDIMMEMDDQELYGMDYWLSQEEGKMQMTEQQLDGSAYWVPDELFHQIVEHSVKQLTRAGFKIIVAHGHGPSTSYVIKHWKEWEEKYGVLVYTLWSSDSEGLGIMTDHAGANETSLMMHYYPDLVHIEQLSPDTAQWPLAVAGRDPRLYASAEQGQKAVDFQVERMTQLLRKSLESIR